MNDAQPASASPREHVLLPLVTWEKEFQAWFTFKTRTNIGSFRSPAACILCQEEQSNLPFTKGFSAFNDVLN